MRHRYLTWAAFAVAFAVLVACIVFGLAQGGPF